MGARRYSASSGRFLQYGVFYGALDNFGLSEDPLTQNRYALAGGNPINFIEIDGHSFTDWKNAHRRLVSAVRKGAEKAWDALGTGGRVAVRFVVGASTPKGRLLLIGAAASAGISLFFGGLAVVTWRMCTAAAKVLGGVEGALLIAHGCVFTSGTLAGGAQIFAAVSLYALYLVYKEGEKALDHPDESDTHGNQQQTSSGGGGSIKMM